MYKEHVKESHELTSFFLLSFFFFFILSLASFLKERTLILPLRITRIYTNEREKGLFSDEIKRTVFSFIPFQIFTRRKYLVVRCSNPSLVLLGLFLLTFTFSSFFCPLVLPFLSSFVDVLVLFSFDLSLFEFPAIAFPLHRKFLFFFFSITIQNMCLVYYISSM